MIEEYPKDTISIEGERVVFSPKVPGSSSLPQLADLLYVGNNLFPLVHRLSPALHLLVPRGLYDRLGLLYDFGQQWQAHHRVRGAAPRWQLPLHSQQLLGLGARAGEEV